jgi:two-component system chemotaxis sensor kinase CheA
MKDDKALKEFISECEDIVESLYHDLHSIEEGVEKNRIDPDLLNAIFRGAHSLKGLAGMFGFKGLQDFAHKLEDLLDKLRLGKFSFTKPVLNQLYESVERLRELVSDRSSGKPEDLGAIAGYVAKIDALLKGETGPAKGANPFEGVDLAPGLLGVLTEYEEFRLKTNIEGGRNLYKVMATFDMMTFDTDLDALNSKIKSFGEVVTTLPSSDPANEMEIKFDLIVGAELGAAEVAAQVGSERVKVAEIPQKQKKKRSPDLAGEVEGFLSTQADAPAADEPRPAPSGDGGSIRSVSQTVRVDIDKLDKIMNVVGELVLYSSQINEFAEKLRLEQGNSGPASNFFKATRALERKIRELQDGVMETRMVPLKQVFDKLQRIVRKVAQECGKEIELEIHGGDTELDKLIIEDLGDPLVHIIRNSIDHGLEVPSEREAAGKSRKGLIRLNAYQRGNHVNIEVQDDGRGIDRERVRQKAREKRLVENADALKDDEVLSIIFLPGFSTKDEVSELSGRGVGLDVVKKNISEMRGLINIDTAPGKGTKFTLTLPITLAIIRALIIEAAGRSYAIPLSSILTSMIIEPKQIRTIERREVMEFRHQGGVQTLPLLRLDLVFGLADKNGSGRKNDLYVVVIELAERRLGLIVDRLHGQQDIVIKSISDALRRTRGIAGATDLGNQQTILVLDVAALVDEATRGV